MGEPLWNVKNLCFVPIKFHRLTYSWSWQKAKDSESHKQSLLSELKERKLLIFGEIIPRCIPLLKQWELITLIEKTIKDFDLLLQ